MPVLRSLTLLLVAAVFEIGGAWLAGMAVIMYAPRPR